MKINIKRVYEAPAKVDGFRVLVDRVWPRGMTKEKAGVDLWLKDIGPTTALRKWFGHDPAKWQEFKKRYTEELKTNKEAVSALKKHAKTGPVTLVYSARDEEHNQAVVLKDFLLHEHKA